MKTKLIKIRYLSIEHEDNMKIKVKNTRTGPRVKQVHVFHWSKNVLLVSINTDQYRVADYSLGGCDNSAWFWVETRRGDSMVEIIAETLEERRWLVEGYTTLFTNRKNDIEFFIVKKIFRDPKKLAKWGRHA